MPSPPRVLVARSRIAPARAVLVTSVAVAVGASLGLGGSAVAQEQTPAARTITSNIFEVKNGVMRLPYGPRSFPTSASPDGTPPPVAASMTISVNAATKTKYKLTSAVIMKGSTANGKTTDSGIVWRVSSTAAVAKKFKGAKVIKGVTFKLVYTEPVEKTVTLKRDLNYQPYATTKNSKVMVFNTSSESGSVEGDGSRG